MLPPLLSGTDGEIGRRRHLSAFGCTRPRQILPHSSPDHLTCWKPSASRRALGATNCSLVRRHCSARELSTDRIVGQELDRIFCLNGTGAVCAETFILEILGRLQMNF